MMHALDPAEAIEVLNLLLKFFGDGERWIKGRFSDRRGNCCLVGAIDFVSSHHAIKGDAAERYLAAAISDERGQRICSNENGEDYARLRAALRRAMRGEWYRASETILRRDSLSDFNDGCKDFAELRALIVQARATAMNDGDPGPAPPASRHRARRVGYGVEGRPGCEQLVFLSDSRLCAPGFGCGAGRRRSAARASARSDTAGTPAPGARIIHVNEYRVDHPLGTHPAREPSPIDQPVAPGCRRKSGRRIRSRFGRSGSFPRPGRSP